MSDQSKFITKIFNLIKNSFDEFRDTDIVLEIKAYNEIPKEKSVFHVDWIGYHDHIDFTMTVVKNFEVFKKKDPKWYKYLLDINSEFLESLNIEVVEQPLILINILHEFGHIHQLLYFLKKYHIAQYSNFESVNWAAVRLILGKPSRKNNIYENSIFFQHMMFDELYANMFKFKHFLKFWGLLNGIVLSWIPCSKRPKQLIEFL